MTYLEVFVQGYYFQYDCKQGFFDLLPYNTHKVSQDYHVRCQKLPQVHSETPLLLVLTLTKEP